MSFEANQTNPAAGSDATRGQNQWIMQLSTLMSNFPLICYFSCFQSIVFSQSVKKPTSCHLVHLIHTSYMFRSRLHAHFCVFCLHARTHIHRERSLIYHSISMDIIGTDLLLWMCNTLHTSDEHVCVGVIYRWCWWFLWLLVTPYPKVIMYFLPSWFCGLHSFHIRICFK